MSSNLRRARPEQCVIHFDAWPQASVSVLQELPVQVRFNPAVCRSPVSLFPLFSKLELGFSTLVVSVVMTIQASFFSIPPYNFTPAQMGLMCIPLMIRSFMTVFIGGALADWLLIRMVRKSTGIHEPENRLWVYLLVPLLAATGCLLYGVGASTGVYWVLPCIRLFLIGVYTNVCLPIALGYGLDSYPELEDEIVQLSNFVRNVGGGALTFCIQPWINASGPRNTIIYLVVIIFVVHVT